MNGFTRPNFSTHQGLLISQFVLFNEGTSGLSGTIQPSQSINGTNYSVVRVTPPNGDAIDLYIDSSGAYGRAVIDPGGPNQTVYDILAYQQIAPGKRMISQYRIEGQPDTYTITHVETNVPISTADLHPPAPNAVWSFAGAQPAPLAMTPFAMLVNATSNGVSGTFVIDTGSSDIVLSHDFAARAHVVMTGQSSVSGVGGEIRVGVGRIDSLTIGGATLSRAMVVVSGGDTVVNASNLTEAQNTVTVNGYLGFPIFGASVVALNTSNATITIEDPNTTTIDHSAGYNALVDLSTGQPTLPMVIDGRTTVNAVLDTGNGSFVVMSQEAVDRHHIPILANEGTVSQVGMPNLGTNNNMDPNEGTEIQDYLNSHQVVRGVAGTEVQRCSTVSSIALGSITYQSTFACVSPSLTGDEIYMGYSFLRNFDFVFDYPQGLLILKPHAQ